MKHKYFHISKRIGLQIKNKYYILLIELNISLSNYFTRAIKFKKIPNAKVRYADKSNIIIGWVAL
jgi:hypothetical protein